MLEKKYHCFYKNIKQHTIFLKKNYINKKKIIIIIEYI